MTKDVSGRVASPPGSSSLRSPEPATPSRPLRGDDPSRVNEILMAQGSQRIEELRQMRGHLCEVLRKCEEYFDGRTGTGCAGTDEMGMLVMIREALRRAES